MKHNRLYAIVTPALLLLGPVFHVLRVHDYPLFRKEVLIVVGVTATLGLICGWIIYAAPRAAGLVVFSLVLSPRPRNQLPDQQSWYPCGPKRSDRDWNAVRERPNSIC